MELKYNEKSCGIVLFRGEGNGRLFLLLHYPNGHWDLPKGHVEKDENEEQTALRELEEETGINAVEFIEGYREQISYFYTTHQGKHSHKEVVFFLASTSESAVKLSHEHHNSIWLPYDQAVEKLTFENAKELLRRAKKFLDRA